MQDMTLGGVDPINPAPPCNSKRDHNAIYRCSILIDRSRQG